MGVPTMPVLSTIVLVSSTAFLGYFRMWPGTIQATYGNNPEELEKTLEASVDVLLGSFNNVWHAAIEGLYS